VTGDAGALPEPGTGAPAEDDATPPPRLNPPTPTMIADAVSPFMFPCNVNTITAAITTVAMTKCAALVLILFTVHSLFLLVVTVLVRISR
jgi:hypothetical protein